MDGLLERGDELATLVGVVADAAAGRGALVLLAGEAGIGKTSLVRALRDAVQADVAFLVGACEPLSVPAPLAPVRELAEAAGAADLGDLETGDRLALARALLEALERRAPALAVIEDAHWADPTTLDVLRILSRRVERTHVALVLTYREDELTANEHLAQLVGDLATRPATRRMRLRPLSSSAVRELAAPAGVDAEQLARVTGGNPFLVVEAIAAREGLPASVRDAMLARVGRLGVDARRVVDAAAVVGQRVPPSLLDALVPGSAGPVEEALARGVLVADGPLLGFRHELLRDAVAATIPPPRRAELHAAVVAALARQPGAADNARLAHHAELAGLPQAAHYAALAAAEADRVGAMRETSLQAARALRLGGGLDDDERFELLVRYAHAANFGSADLEEPVAPAEEAIALARRLGDPAREGRALVALAYAFWSLDRVAEAKAAAERAVRLLEGTSDEAELVRAEATRLRMEATAFDPAVAIDAGPRALDLARRCGMEEARIDIEISVALARGHRGEREALDRLGDALAAARRAGPAIPVVRTYVNLVYIAVHLREHALVDALVREALEVFDEFQTTIPGHAIEGYGARSLLDRGRWAEARAILTRTDRNWASEQPVVAALDSLIGARRGEPNAERRLEGAWAELRRVPESSRHATIRVALVEAAWLGGDGTAARRRLREALDSPALRFARPASDLAVWAARLGLDAPALDRVPAPVAAELAGDWRGAIRSWQELDAPYEAALAALPGDDRAAREALATLHRLGADAAARAFVRERAARAGRAPRGPRRSTLANPAGLTRREQEVLNRLASGATNAAIAAALHLSERTVAHHVSAILRKLGATNRVAAVDEARARNLLAAQDGTSAAQDGQG